jgi:biopolymer transport protein ExbB
MNINKLAGMLGDASYGFLMCNFLWGLYCVILLWRRLSQLAFRSEREQLDFLDEMEADLNSGDLAAASARCDRDVRALPSLATVAIANHRLGYDQLRQLVAELMQRDVLAGLEHRLSWIATVIKSGPLLGLFGTVLGMMAAFGRIGTGEKVQPSQIAHEISIALICTAMGLMTAIPFNYLLSNLNIRVRSLQESLSSGLTRFLESLRDTTASAPAKGK